MKNAPVTTEHTITASYLIGLFRQVRGTTPTEAYDASIDGMAQALANLGARLQHKAWEEGLAIGFRSAGHGLPEDYLIDNPYPELDL